MTSKHPKDTPLDEWTNGWLKLDVASILDRPEYLMMYDHEKLQRGWPVTRDEMVEFIRKDREAA